MSNDPFARLTQTDTRVAHAAAEPMDLEYRGQQGPLFWLALRTAILTLFTLGIYRFWAKTRIRKYYWSATAPGADPMEYTGNGLEKLLGFLIAVAFLAIYLGLFQLILSFVGLSVFSPGEGPEAQAMQVAFSQLTLLAVLPFIFYAQFRARRYILSRTRWRGVRFGVDAAAWGYVWRAILHSIITVVSLGLLLPRQTFWLEKYKIDRTWFGNTQFEQGGSWIQLYPAMRHYFFAFIFVVGPIALAALQERPVWLFILFFGLPWMFFATVYYRVKSFEILARDKTLGSSVRFSVELSATKVFWTIILGTLLASVCAGMVFSFFTIVATNVMGMSRLEIVGQLEQIISADSLDLQIYAGFAIFVLGYLFMQLSYGAFGMIFVGQPILEHYVENIRVLNPDALEEIEQRSRDEMVEAEGFADALDVGAGI